MTTHDGLTDLSRGPVGFVGLGRMGEPMANRLLEHGVELVVWNRTSAKVDALCGIGAIRADSVADVFERCGTVILMLSNGEVVDEVLGRTTSGFQVRVEDRTVVNMGTVATAYSAALASHLQQHGGRYVEAPVSGSRVPAQNGELVAMIAGDPAILDAVEELVAPMTTATFRCGVPPQALGTKLAVNVFLITLVTGLAESMAFAERLGLDLEDVRKVLDAGPMASAVSRSKLAKVLEDDWSPQAASSDVLYNNRLILEAAYDVAADLPLLSVCERLFAATEKAGLGGADMIAVLEALRQHMAPSTA